MSGDNDYDRRQQQQQYQLVKNSVARTFSCCNQESLMPTDHVVKQSGLRTNSDDSYRHSTAA